MRNTCLFMYSYIGDQASEYEGLRGYRTIFMSHSTEHEFIMLINVKMPTIFNANKFLFFSILVYEQWIFHAQLS